MDPNQNKQPNLSSPPKPLSDQQAQTLLTINSLDSDKKIRGSNNFLYFVIAVVILLVASSLILGYRNSHDNKKSSSVSNPLTSKSNPFNSNNGQSSINSETQYCSNPVNAQLSC